MNDYSKNLHKSANAKLFEFAKNMRTNSTKGEYLLWEQLRAGRLEGLKFRRQHPIKNFIPDFYCHEKLLVIEVDGSIHDIEEVKLRDEAKETTFKELGIKVIRFSNEQVIKEMHKVLIRIKDEAGLIIK
jgi:cyclase